MEDARTQCPYRYIAIEGVIGVGKTSLCSMLAEHLEGKPVYEDFETNPFIEDYYRDPRAHAFKTQLFFLISRFKTNLELPQPDLFDTIMVMDYIFHKDRIYATVTLDDHELSLYDTIWHILEPKVNHPDLVVYLQASTRTLLDRIRRRGRDYERSISFDYLEMLNNAYNEFFFHYDAAPVLIIDTEDIDFVADSSQLSDLIDVIIKPHSGISYYHPGGV